LAQAVQVFSVDCPVIPVITMVRLITAFAFALVSKADYICTTAPAAWTSDCQCLTMVEHTVLTMPPGAANGQSDFQLDTVIMDFQNRDAIAYKFPDGQELCVTHHPNMAWNLVSMAPCDGTPSWGGIFIHLTTGQLQHIGNSTDRPECIEPSLTAPNWPCEYGKPCESVAAGECSSLWTISSTPLCSSTSEMVI